MRNVRERQSWLALLGLALVLGLGLWFIRPTPVRVIARLCDPLELAELGPRGANPRVNEIIYWLYQAELRGDNPTNVLSQALQRNDLNPARVELVQAALLINLRNARRLGLLTNAYDNLDHLSRGKSATITRGPYANQLTGIDHIVPLSLAPEVGNELANLEIMPAAVNRKKSNRVNSKHVSHAEKLHAASLLSQESLDRVKAQAKQFKYTAPAEPTDD